jgi:hypothetical protein
MRILCAIVFIFSFLLAGCESQPPPVGAQPQPSPPLATIAPPVEPAPVPAEPQPAPAPMPETETVKAEVGVGKKGRSLDEYEGIVVTPVKTIWSTQEFLAYNVQVKKALDLFNATEGRMPKSHEEFMEKIIAPNLIKLPQLPEGQRYKWDPQTNQLMVERPKKTTTPGFTNAPR